MGWPGEDVAVAVSFDVQTAPGHSDARAWELARCVGAVQEAQRLGQRRVGTEHLLLAVYADPFIRSRLASLGADLREVQARIGARAADPVAYRVARTSEVSDAAQAILVGLAEEIDSADETADRGRPGTGSGERRLAPAALSRVHRRLLARLLDDAGPHRAREIVDELGLPRDVGRLADERFAPDLSTVEPDRRAATTPDVPRD